MMKITAFMMTEKALLFLRHAFGQGYAPLFDRVVVGRDRKVQDDYAEPIIECCHQAGVPVFERNQAPHPPAVLAMAIGWRWLIPTAQFPRLIVFHDSLLPRYRGFAPTVNALLNGEAVIGVTALWASEGYDEGPIILQAQQPISYPIKIQQAIHLQTELYVQLGQTILEMLKNGNLPEGKEQEHEGASYSIWRDEEDYHIDWSRDAQELSRFIDALGFPYRGAKTRVGGLGYIRIWDAIPSYDYKHEILHPGKIFKKDPDGVWVICGKGSLKLTSMTLDEDNSPYNPGSLRIRFT
jgi:methionyl-tRNA formyltransferase